MERGGYIYILTNKVETTTYIGVTSDLLKRIYEHKNTIKCSYTDRFGIKYLMYYEYYNSISEAILREKQLKKYPKQWKWNLINELNPGHIDLYNELQDGKFRILKFTKR